MNIPPETFIRVQAADPRDFLRPTRSGRWPVAVPGGPAGRATDRQRPARVVSHGTRRVARENTDFAASAGDVARLSAESFADGPQNQLVVPRLQSLWVQCNRIGAGLCDSDLGIPVPQCVNQ